MKIAALVRDAGTDHNVPGRADVPRAQIHASGLVAPGAMLELAVAFHHTVANDANAANATITRLNGPTDGSYAHYTDIAHHMASTTTRNPSAARWIDDEAIVHQRWRALTTTRRSRLRRR
ncbi:hypothetical protein [Streptomyces sp. SM13]|uniref:hypothetical protein n=1 Tax=Streptomyces sp. SM13 TaxID=1983803 RepID=UPI000CD5A08C|nr:hypothetical protein [Streptomyces sp. SM13]